MWRPRRPGGVDKHRCPKAEKDARRHGVSGGDDDSELGKGCLVRALFGIQPGGLSRGVTSLEKDAWCCCEENGTLQWQVGST